MPGGKTSRRKPSKSKAAIKSLAVVVVDYEQIARRAYEIFLNRGGAHGHDVDDWLQAELELGTSAGSRDRGPTDS